MSDARNWKIRTEGQPKLPYYRSNRRRTHRWHCTEDEIKAIAEGYAKHQGLKILWIKEDA